MQTKITSFIYSAHQRTVSSMLSSCVTRYQAALEGFLVTKSDWCSGLNARTTSFLLQNIGEHGKKTNFPKPVGILTKTQVRRQGGGGGQKEPKRSA